MNSFITTLFFGLVAFSQTATADYQSPDDLASYNFDDNARQFALNDTSGQLLLGLSFLAVVLVPVVVYYLVSSQPSLRRVFETNQGENYNNQYSNRYARSAGSAFDFSNLNVIQWIQMMQEIYDKFDYNDIECQKRLICEVMQSPEYFGEASEKVRSGFEYAKYLEFLSMPDDFREILDEYIDASERAIGVKTCQEYFDCPYSLKDSVKRNFYGNAL
jgi:hypothetical protein